MDPREVSSALPWEQSFESRLGLRYERVEAEEVVASFDARDELFDRNGRVHSGVFSSVAEGTASVGTAASVIADGMDASGMSNDTAVIADVFEGTITAVATRRSAAPDLWTWDVDFRDESGARCAVSLVLIAVRPRSPRGPDTGAS